MEEDQDDAITHLNWSRFRDDGFAILPDAQGEEEFTSFLQNLHPGIVWTVQTGRRVDYLDLTISITDDGKLLTDVFSKNCHSYLPPFSCHSPSVFRGLAVGIGTRLRMLISDDLTLEERVNEYAKYLVMSGWKWNRALRDIKKGASKNRSELLKKSSKKVEKKIAWVTMYDPRVPSKTKIINKNLHLLHEDPQNKVFFPKTNVISADRKRKNLGAMFMPTLPKRQVAQDDCGTAGFFPCHHKCDTCEHSEETHSFTSPWDQRKWTIRQHISCTDTMVIYLMRCRIHPDLWYVGSTTNLKQRWRGHKSDVKLKRTQRCKVAHHVNSIDHPEDPQLRYLYIVPIEKVHREDRLLSREIYWQANLGTLQVGLNQRKDLNAALRCRIQY
jgi:hypothetical protein